VHKRLSKFQAAAHTGEDADMARVRQCHGPGADTTFKLASYVRIAWELMVGWGNSDMNAPMELGIAGTATALQPTIASAGVLPGLEVGVQSWHGRTWLAALPVPRAFWQPQSYVHAQIVRLGVSTVGRASEIEVPAVKESEGLAKVAAADPGRSSASLREGLHARVL